LVSVPKLLDEVVIIGVDVGVGVAVLVSTVLAVGVAVLVSTVLAVGVAVLVSTVLAVGTVVDVSAVGSVLKGFVHVLGGIYVGSNPGRQIPTGVRPKPGLHGSSACVKGATEFKASAISEMGTKRFKFIK
jgi:hypothetical protein